MRLPQTLLWLLAFITTIHALALPASFASITESSRDLFKRKGGGGGRGGGGSSSSSSGGGSSSSSGGGSRGGSSSSSSSSSSSGSGSGTKGGVSSTTSNAGGRTSSGSGTSTSYGRGGAYYGGGSSVPYRAGATSTRGIAPYFLGGAALGILPGLWLYGAYAYAYPHPYTYHNDTSNRNETHNVQCLCGNYEECGCDSNNDTDYINSVANNRDIARVAPNGTLYINGTLANGTTASGAAAGSLHQSLAEMSGFWMVAAGVTYTMWFM